MDFFWHILQAIGVGAAAGLSPLVALAAVIVCIAVGLGVTTTNTDYDFMESGVLVVVAVIVLLQSFALVAIPGGMALRIAADRRRAMPVHVAVATVLGALAGGVVFGTESDPLIVGLLIGGVTAAVVAYASGNLLAGVSQRIEANEQRQTRKASKEDVAAAKRDTESSRRVLAFGVDIVTIIAVAVALLAPVAGLILPLAALLLVLRGGRKEDKKHEGLRVLK